MKDQPAIAGVALARERQSQQCAASGWPLRISSADSNRDATCPLCGEQVPPQPDIVDGRAVQVIKAHPLKRRPL
jgi:hypothetical protein